MRVLGVDPGTQHLGYGVVDVDGTAVRAVAWGTVEGGRGLDIAVRLHRIHQGLAAITAQHRPEVLAVEEPFVSVERGAKAAVAVGQAQAVALLLAAGMNIPIHRYSPAKVKSAVANYGAGSKAQVQRTVQLVLGMSAEPMSEDASDALAVALTHVQEWRAAQRVRSA
jgi:crossover junction endodeoxyribonuclease RuvC